MAQSVYGIGEMLLARLVRCFCGVLFAGMVPKVNIFPVHLDVSHPCLVFPIPGDPSVRRRSPRVTGLVLPVSAHSGDWSEISSTAVKSVSVDVVTLKAVPRRKAEHLTVQQNASGSVLRLIANGIAVYRQVPAPLVHPVGIGGVNQGVGSNAAISGAERDTYGGIIEAHSDSPPSVTPPAVRSGAGVSCRLNYTPYQEWAA